VELSKYKVVMNGTTLPNEDREKVIRELCELFHSRPSTMEKLLDGKSVSLKKEYARDEAEKICRAIRNAGAQCRMMPVKMQELAVVEDDYSYLSGLSLDDSGNAIMCPSCERQCDSQWESCQYCGHTFVRREQQDSQFSFGVYEDDPSETAEQVRPRSTIKEAVIRFVGPNADYYAQKFSAMGSVRNPTFRVSWHWPAFFVFFFWALYRKMWAWAAINMLVALFLTFILPPSPLWFLYSLVWPLIANYLYYRHIGGHIRKVRSLSREDRGQYLAEKGGVSRSAMWIGVAASIGLSALSGNMMMNQLMSRYEEMFGAPPGEQAYQEQMRGDGSILESVGDPESKLATTSRVLSTLANGLKMIIAAGNEELVDNTISGLIDKSDNEEIRDAWGSPVEVDRESNRVVFLSPGPDGQTKTDDDILHMVNLLPRAQ
jgi:hypothetical protein